MLTTAVPIAEPDQAPATPDTTADTAAAPTCAFHISAAWFASWRSAYVPPDASPVTLCGVPMLADRARIGPIGYDRLRSQTNIHTARFDAPPGGPIAPGFDAILLAGRDLVTMEYLGEGSPLLVAARGWGTRSRLSIVPHARAPLTDCRAPYADWLARRGKRDRKRWPQLERRLIADHDVAFAVEDGRHALPALLDRIFAIERSGWKGREGTAILDDPRDLLFYTRLAERAAAEGALRIATLSVDGRIVAFEYGILGGDRLFLLKIGYDETFETLSIGHVLALMHIRHCCADPAIAWYDKLSNGMTPARYKLRFNDTLDTLYRVTLYGPSWRGTLLQARDRTRATAKRVRDRWRQRRTAR